MQMGSFAAKRIGQLIGATSVHGKQKGFHYFDKGDMATIGRSAAVANIQWPFKAHWSGFPAWVSWLAVHIFFLIGFQNRFLVFFSWARTYIGQKDGVRLITGSQELPGWGVVDQPSGILTTRPLDASSSK